ncbi:MAG: LPS export ABC transporter permease LptF [Rhodobacteraceae bacterium]|jgi:lipopolysaccharide export system permease protein|nr:LPS export ABC transporter permease LptF [Paracoccaceae bacterium]
MSRLDRYLLAQLLMLFGFFALVLVGVYWINRAVQLFDRIVGDGQTAAVFFELTILALPNVIRLVLPVAAFAAAVYVVHRAATESELVVMQAAGLSPWRLARPVLAFGLIVAALLSVLNHHLVPASRTALLDRRAEIAENIAARFLTAGAFLHPAPGITLYIREITPEGEMRDLYLADTREQGMQVTYTAQSALLVRAGGRQKLVMLDGMSQTLRLDDGRLATTRFTDFAYDIAALIDGGARQGRTVEELSTPELLGAAPELLAETRSTPAVMLHEAHARLAHPFLATVGALIGAATLMLGAFSRLGVWRQVLGAVVLLILVQLAANAAEGVARRDAWLWPVAYLPLVTGGLTAAGLLWLAGRRRAVPAAPPDGM